MNSDLPSCLDQDKKKRIIENPPFKNKNKIKLKKTMQEHAVSNTAGSYSVPILTHSENSAENQEEAMEPGAQPSTSCLPVQNNIFSSTKAIELDPSDPDSSKDFTPKTMGTSETANRIVPNSAVHTPPPLIPHLTLDASNHSTIPQCSFDNFSSEDDSFSAPTVPDSETPEITARQEKKLRIRPALFSIGQLVLLKAPGKPWWPGIIVECLGASKGEYFVAHLGIPEFVVATAKQIKNFPSGLCDYTKQRFLKVLMKHKNLKRAVLSAIRMTLRLKMPETISEAPLNVQKLFSLARTSKFRNIGKVILNEAIYIQEMHGIRLSQPKALQKRIADSNSTAPQSSQNVRRKNKVRWDTFDFICRPCHEYYKSEPELLRHMTDISLLDFHSACPWPDVEQMTSDEIAAEIQELSKSADAPFSPMSHKNDNLKRELAELERPSEAGNKRKIEELQREFDNVCKKSRMESA